MIQISAKNMFIIWSLKPISIIQIKEYERICSSYYQPSIMNTSKYCVCYLHDYDS